MFSARYFAPHFYAPRYFAEGGTGVGSPLVAPTLSFVYATSTAIRLSFTDATGGDGAYVYSINRDGVEQASGITSPYDDSDVVAGTLYTYSVTVTDGTAATEDSNEVTAALPFDGTGGGGTIPPGAAQGYYVKRARVVYTAGQDNFDLGFNLNNNNTTADEDLAQSIFDEGDRFVDSRAFVMGLAVESGATSPHYIATSNVIFEMLSDWASRWARAQGYLLRGVTGSEDGAKAEGQMADMKIEAEKRIDELLMSILNSAAFLTEGIQIVTPCCHPCFAGPIVVY